MNLKPARERICEASTGELSFILFLCALFVVTCSFAVFLPAQSTESGPQRAVADLQSSAQTQPDLRDESNLRGKWGVQVVAVRLTASRVPHRFLDFASWTRETKTPDEKGYEGIFAGSDQQWKLSVPVTSLGAQRSRGDPIAGRNYFIFFTNSSGVIIHGSKVTITIGDFKAEENYTVQ